MDQEIEYAEMLEIPVSTVNVVRKRRKTRRAPSLQQSLIDQVNEKIAPQAQTEEAPDVEPPTLPDVEAPSTQDFTTTLVEDDVEEKEEQKEKKATLKKWLSEKSLPTKAEKIIYRVEIACACVLCFGIFLTNIFLPTSAINTFFRTMTTPSTTEESTTFSDFELSPIVGEYSTATIHISPEGVVYFTAEGCVYPAVDGKIIDLSQKEGKQTVTIEHSPTFTSVISGLDHVYYTVGEEVKHNVPVAFSKGDSEVQMTMYSQGELLNCLQIEGQNCLAWVETDR